VLVICIGALTALMMLEFKFICTVPCYSTNFWAPVHFRHAGLLLVVQHLTKFVTAFTAVG
jgi:hypothetical protein